MVNTLPLICLSGSDLTLSAMCLGATAFCAGFAEAQTDRLYQAFRQAGGNCFDTAHCYSFWIPGGLGAAERNLGQCIRRHGDAGRVRIISKGGHPQVLPDYPRPERYLGPNVLAADIAESLDRLQMDTIDLYLLHRDDPRVPVGELIDLLNVHITAGRLGAIGVSNWSMARIVEANAYAARNGRHGFVASQPQFNLGVPNTPAPASDPAMRYLTPADLSWHREHRLPVVCYAPTANGYFASGGTRARNEYENAASRGRLVRAEQLASQFHATANQIALAYLLGQSFPVIPVLGTSAPEHLRDALAATKISLTAEQVRWLECGEYQSALVP